MSGLNKRCQRCEDATNSQIRRSGQNKLFCPLLASGMLSLTAAHALTPKLRLDAKTTLHYNSFGTGQVGQRRTTGIAVGRPVKIQNCSHNNSSMQMKLAHKTRSRGSLLPNNKHSITLFTYFASLDQSNQYPEITHGSSRSSRRIKTYKNNLSDLVLGGIDLSCEMEPRSVIYGSEHNPRHSSWWGSFHNDNDYHAQQKNSDRSF